MARHDDETCAKCGSDKLDYCADCRGYSLCVHCDFCSDKTCYEYKD